MSRNYLETGPAKVYTVQYIAALHLNTKFILINVHHVLTQLSLKALY